MLYEVMRILRTEYLLVKTLQFLLFITDEIELSRKPSHGTVSSSLVFVNLSLTLFYTRGLGIVVL